MDIKPVFIVGCPRSGTTIFQDLLSCHEGFSWVSNWVNTYPYLPGLNTLNRIYRWPLLGPRLYILKSRIPILPFPAEPKIFFNAHLSRFQWHPSGPEPPRRQTENDMSSREVLRIRNAVASLCRYHGGAHFLTKWVDFPRMRYFLKAFPEARFVHLVRDLRATVHSAFKMVSWDHWGTWREREWWIQAWPREWQETWRDRYGDPFSFVACLWKYFRHSIRKEAASIPARQYMEIRYEDLMESTDATIKSVLRFSGLPHSANLRWYLREKRLFSRNFKWVKELGAEEKSILERVLNQNEFIEC